MTQQLRTLSFTLILSLLLISVISAQDDAQASPLYRVNVGGVEIADDTGNWLADAPTQIYSTGGLLAPESAIETNDTAAPDEVFAMERFSDHEWDFPVPNGQHLVRFYFMEAFDGNFADDARLFDIEIEGDVPAEFDDFDIYEEAEMLGNTGIMREILVDVDDNNLDINFISVVENATVRAIEIIPMELTPTDADLTLTDSYGFDISEIEFGLIDEITASSTVEISLNNIGTDEEVSITNIQITGDGADAFSLTHDDITTIDAGTKLPVGVVFAPTDVGIFEATLQIDYEGAETGSTSLDLQGTGYIAVPGTILYRINVGGEEIAPIENDVVWAEDSLDNPSPHRLDAGGEDTFVSPELIDVSDPSIGLYVPTDIFSTERWDSGQGEDMQWAFENIPPNADILVRLYFAELFFDSEESRVFDIAVEGEVPTEFTEIDQVAVAGLFGGFMLESQVTVTDGTLNLDFMHLGFDSPAVKAIEIISMTPTTPATILVCNADELVSSHDIHILEDHATHLPIVMTLGDDDTLLQAISLTTPIGSINIAEDDGFNSVMVQLSDDDDSEEC